MKTVITFSSDNFQDTCDRLAKSDPMLAKALARDGYPPMWTRPADFPSLVWIILEQQVGLASAKAAYLKLKERLGEITPPALLSLTEEELRACYFSRQKSTYVRGLAQAIVEGGLNLEGLGEMDDACVRRELTALKGIGDWTCDVFLMFCLQRSDIFPLGDIALVNSMKHEWQISGATKEELALIAEGWRPWRSVAAMMLWHAYLERKRKPVSGKRAS